MAVREIQLQLKEIISVIGLEKRLKQQVINYQQYKVQGLRYLDYNIKNYKKSSVNNIREKISKFKSIVKQKRFLYYFNYKIPQEIYIS